MQQPDVPAVLRLAQERGLRPPIEKTDVSYFLSTIDLYVTDAPGMTRWRKQLFLATARITADAAEYFNLPRDGTVIIGSRIGV